MGEVIQTVIGEAIVVYRLVDAEAFPHVKISSYLIFLVFGYNVISEVEESDSFSVFVVVSLCWTILGRTIVACLRWRNPCAWETPVLAFLPFGTDCSSQYTELPERSPRRFLI